MKFVLPVILVFSFSLHAGDRNDCGKETLDAKEACHQKADSAIDDSNAEGYATAIATKGDDMLQNTGDFQGTAIKNSANRYDGATDRCTKVKDYAEKACTQAMTDSEKR